MLKKVFLTAAIAALVFSGCDSDSSTEPSSTAKDSQYTKGAIDKREYTADSDDGGCVVKKLSSNSYSIAYTQGGASIKIISTVDGDVIENEYQSTYGASVPKSYIESLCEANKEEAKSKNATVTCTANTITIKEIEDTYLTFDEAMKSAKETCKDINGDDEETSDSIETITPDEDHPAVCSSRKTENSFVMRAEDQDSLRLEATAEYVDEIYTFVLELEFVSRIPMSVIEEACDDLRRMYSDSNDEPGSVQVKCDGRLLTVRGREETDENPISNVAASMSSFCNEIDLTGAFPD